MEELAKQIKAGGKKKKRRVGDLSSKELSSMRDRLRTAKKLGMNIVNVMTADKDADKLNTRINSFIKRKSK